MTLDKCKHCDTITTIKETDVFNTSQAFLISAFNILLCSPLRRFFFFLIFKIIYLFLAKPHDMPDLSSLIRDQPKPPSGEAQSLSHWTTREVLVWLKFSKISFQNSFGWVGSH